LDCSSEAGVVGRETFGALDQPLDERAQRDVGCGAAEDAGADGGEEVGEGGGERGFEGGGEGLVGKFFEDG